MLSKGQNYILYIIGSLLFISIPVLSSPDLTKVDTSIFSIAPFKQSFCQYCLLLIFFYVNYFFIIPRFYLTRKYAVFLFLLVISFFIVSYLPKFLVPWTPGFMQPSPDFVPRDLPADMPDMPRRMDNMHQPLMFGGGLWQFLLVASLSFLLRMNQRLVHMKNEKLKTEVSYLKAQINPHFLFNTLNSLYALALEKSDAAPDGILKLSGMMRYVVTESSRDRVALESELNYIRNYISLQELRMDDTTVFNLSITGSSAGKSISPLVLIPFIENAFKYGLNPEKKSDILINITTEADQLCMVVKNNKVNTNLPPEEASGRGIQNTRMRLEFLYPDKYSLTINEDKETFEVKLILLLV